MNSNPAAAPPWRAGSTPICVLLLALNEEHQLEEVLENLKGWAQQVFLVDSYSADGTVDVALRHGVQVVQRRFRGFGDQWNFAVRELPITAPWTMKLDPDERIPDQLKGEIDAAVRAGGADGLSVERRLWFLGRRLPIRQRLVRLWRTGKCRFTDVQVNEQPLVDGRIHHLRGALEHHDSPCLAHWIDKQNRYTTAEALADFGGREFAERPQLIGTREQRRAWMKLHYQKLPFRFAALFLYHYIWCGAWRAGRVGWIWAHMRTEVYRWWAYKHLEVDRSGQIPAAISQGSRVPDPRVPQHE